MLFVDNYSLLHLAKGIRAFNECFGTDEERANAFKQCALVSYSADHTYVILEEYPSLNELLILVLEADIDVIKSSTIEKVELRDALWSKYEVMRRLMAYEYDCLVVIKS